MKVHLKLIKLRRDLQEYKYQLTQKCRESLEIMKKYKNA